MLVGYPTKKKGLIIMQVVNNYTARTDSKKRITLRKAKYNYYYVKEYANGCLILEPRELIKPKDISEEALKTMDESISNLSKGKVSAPVDLSDF